MTDRREWRISGFPPPFSHYTDAVSTNGFLFISGIVACDQRGDPVAKGDVVGQARVVFDLLGRALEAAQLTAADVVKVTVLLVNIEDRAVINSVRKEFFGESRPASTLVEVSALVHPDLLLEVEAIAAMPLSPQATGPGQ
jgi:2-iminobutanoate/2-iminopropanoate deaminase